MTPRTTSAVVALTVLLAGAACGGSASKPATVRPADASTATRTVEINTSDSLMFDPASVTVKKGETVTFKVNNTSGLVHEFDVGTTAFQDEHEKEMRAMPAGMMMSDEPTAIELQPGQTKTMTLTFPASGTLLYACHVVGHYPAGMKGQIKVT